MGREGLSWGMVGYPARWTGLKGGCTVGALEFFTEGTKHEAQSIKHKAQSTKHQAPSTNFKSAIAQATEDHLSLLFLLTAEPFEEDIDRDEGAIFLSDEIASVNIVHADACGDVFEHEMIVLCHCWFPLLKFQFRYEFCLCRMCAFDVGLHGPNDAISPNIAGHAKKAHGCTGHLAGKFRHPP